MYIVEWFHDGTTRVRVRNKYATLEEAVAAWKQAPRLRHPNGCDRPSLLDAQGRDLIPTYLDLEILRERRLGLSPPTDRGRALQLAGIEQY